MSFSSRVKEELSYQTGSAMHCRIAEIAAILSMCGQIFQEEDGKVSIKIQTENLAVARKYFTLLKKTYNIDTDVKISEEQMRNVIDKIGDLSEPVSPLLIKNSCCQRAFLRGAFLCIGSMSDPQKSYHLEFVCNSEPRAQALSQLLTRCELDCAIMQRRGAHIVYLKRSGQISTLLGLMGATRAMMHYENILAQRSLHESVLRATNCDHSNMLRQLSAAQRQISALQYLEARSLLAALPPALRETAELRLKNPDASLEQLGEMLDPPLGKSGVNHRLRKIMQYAQASGAPVLNGDDQNVDPEAVPQA